GRAATVPSDCGARAGGPPTNAGPRKAARRSRASASELPRGSAAPSRKTRRVSDAASPPPQTVSRPRRNAREVRPERRPRPRPCPCPDRRPPPRRPEQTSSETGARPTGKKSRSSRAGATSGADDGAGGLRQSWENDSWQRWCVAVHEYLTSPAKPIAILGIAAGEVASHADRESRPSP